MAEMCKRSVLINDLLSFLTCKLRIAPKDKILSCVNEYYSETAILEAQKALLEALPIKKSTRHGRRVKHPDPLVAIYDCIQLIPGDDLPIFVCKDLNNVPNLKIIKAENKGKEYSTKSKNLQCKKEIQFQSIEKEPSSHIEEVQQNSEDENEEIDEELCRQEQKEMRVQISKMKSIIEELKVEFQKFKSPKLVNSVTKPIRETALVTKPAIIEEIQEDMDVDAEDHSKLGGLARLQKLIDEEDALHRDEFRESEIEDSDDDDDDDDDDFGYMEETMKPSKASPKVKTTLPCIKKSSSDNSTELIEKNKETLEPSSESIEISALSDDDVDQMEEDEQETFQNSKTGRKPGGENNKSKASNLHQCPLCKKTFKSNFELRFHSKLHIKESSYDCTMCTKSFPKRKSFLAHFFRCLEAKKDGLKDHFCSICGSFHAEISGLKSHLPAHAKSKPFGCDQCTYRFHSEVLLKGHVNAQHNPLNKFMCSLCSLSYISKTYLMAHIRVHTGERPYKCDMCSYRFGDRATCKNHLMRHAFRETVAAKGKGFRFKCELCTYASMFIPPFRNHMMSHSKKNGFVPCPECFAPLVNQRAVLVHLRNYCKNNVVAKS